MAARLTDRQKKKIVADYVELKSINAAAKRNNVSWKKAKDVIAEDEELTKKLEQKKEANTLEMLAFMDSRKEAAQIVIDKYLEALADSQKLKKASLAQIATALGIVVDKFTKNTANGNDSLNKLDELLKGFKNAVKSKTT